MARLTEAEKKRHQRQRAKRGGKVFLIEIMDREAWEEFLREKGLVMGSFVPDRVLADATGTFIWKLCRYHQQQKAERQLADIQPSVTGLIDRETNPHDGSWRLFKSKDLREPVEIEFIDPEPDQEAVDPRLAADKIKEFKKDGFQIKKEE